MSNNKEWDETEFASKELKALVEEVAKLCEAKGVPYVMSFQSSQSDKVSGYSTMWHPAGRDFNTTMSKFVHHLVGDITGIKNIQFVKTNNQELVEAIKGAACGSSEECNCPECQELERKAGLAEARELVEDLAKEETEKGKGTVYDLSTGKKLN